MSTKFKTDALFLPGSLRPLSYSVLSFLGQKLRKAALEFFCPSVERVLMTAMTWPSFSSPSEAMAPTKASMAISGAWISRQKKAISLTVLYERNPHQHDQQ